MSVFHATAAMALSVHSAYGDSSDHAQSEAMMAADRNCAVAPASGGTARQKRPKIERSRNQAQNADKSQDQPLEPDVAFERCLTHHQTNAYQTKR
jgi:hypothetical protein